MKPCFARIVVLGSLLSIPLAGASSAQQAQLCASDSIPSMMTGWSSSVTLPRFDPALGVLKTVSITAESTVSGSAALENLDLLPATVSTNFSLIATVSRPAGGGVLVSSAPSQMFVDMVTPYDGTADFGGTSGVTHAGIMMTAINTSVSPPPASDLVLFTGPSGNPGTITLPVDAFGTSGGTGAGNLLLQFLQSASATVTVCYDYDFDCDGDGIGDPDELLMGSLDCNMNGLPDECEPDCNLNGVADSCDIASMTSADCNGNAIPDDCEPDCNGNNVADDCDIASMTSADCNGNAIPDDCELDCNGNSVPDECDLASMSSLDVNGNNVPDECEDDCNGNNIPDSFDISTMASQDCNLDGIPDECQVDCNLNGVPDDCDLASMSSADCNGNSIPDDCEPDCNGNNVADDCDLAAMTSADCDLNGVPDECQPDCNLNGIADVCDVSSMGSLDCNTNGIPDECEIGPGVDCNFNGIPDDCDAMVGPSQDLDMNGIPDECETSTSKCNGDGGDQMGCTNCPCGNNAPQGTIGGGLHTPPRRARPLMTGFPSMMNDTMTLRVVGGAPSSFGILFSSESAAPTNPLNPCFGLGSGVQSAIFDGLRCLGAPVKRHPVRMSDINGNFGFTTAPWGPPAGPPQGLVARGSHPVGSTTCWQVYYRDNALAVCMTGANTTNALRVVILP